METPRTDAYESTYAQARQRIQASATEWMTLVPADFARRLERENARLRAALERLRDCDWVITPADRMEAVCDIAREALA